MWNRRWGRAACSLIYQVLQLFAWLKKRDLLSGDIHTITRLGIAPYARVTLAGTKAAEAADLDLISGSEGVYDAVEDSFHDHFTIATGDVGYSGNFLDEVSLRHKLYIPPEMRLPVKY